MDTLNRTASSSQLSFTTNSVHTVKASIRLRFQTSVLRMCLLRWYQTGIWLPNSQCFAGTQEEVSAIFRAGGGGSPHSYNCQNWD